MFIDFINFYRRFIHHFASKALRLTNLLKTDKQSAETQKKSRESTRLQLDDTNFLRESGRKSFLKLKKTFAKAVLIQHFNSERETKLETDASSFALSDILSQKNEHEV